MMKEELLTFGLENIQSGQMKLTNLNFLICLHLKIFLSHLLEEPVDDITWLRIKQPGTYTIHFDLITDSFLFKLHTRGEIIHFSGHNPKHDVNLEKDENCLLAYQHMPTAIRAGSKIYVYYNI